MPSQSSSAIESIELLTSLDAVATLLRVVCDLSGLRFATVAEVTDQRWTACAVHDRMDFSLAAGTELELEATMCSAVRSSHDPVIITDVTQDLTYCDHPLPQRYGWQSYLSLPVFRPNGTFFGTLCAFDRQPAPLLAEPSVIATLTGFARLLGELISREEQRRAEAPGPHGDSELRALREQLSVLFEQDLQRPLQTLAHAMDDLAGQVAPVRLWQADLRRLAQRSAEANDFVRARLGHGLPLKPVLVEGLNARIEALVARLRIEHPAPNCSTALPPQPAALRLDPERLLQALEAVLAFSLARTPAGQAVRLSGAFDERTYRLEVESGGAALEPAEITRLFQPVVVQIPGTAATLNLALYLAQDIVRGHGGSLDARSAAGRNLLTLTLPTALD